MDTRIAINRRDEKIGGAALVAATLVALCWGLVGCAPASQPSVPVDAPGAHDSLHTTAGRSK